MKRNRTISLLIIITFLVSIAATSDMRLFSQSKEKNEITDLLKKAEENYQNGNFRKAIEIYENIIMLPTADEIENKCKKIIQSIIPDAKLLK